MYEQLDKVFFRALHGSLHECLSLKDAILFDVTKYVYKAQ